MFSLGCCSPLFLDGRLGPPDRHQAVGVGRRRGCACQPPAAACVHQMLANQAAPELPTWLQLQPGLLFTRRETLRLAPQALGALQILPLSPRLPLGAVCPAPGVPLGVRLPQGRPGGMMLIWSLLPLPWSAPIKSRSLLLPEPSCFSVPGKAPLKISGLAFPALPEQFPASVRALSPRLSGSAHSPPC